MNYGEILKKFIDFLNIGGFNFYFMCVEMCSGDFLESGIVLEKMIFVYLVSN